MNLASASATVGASGEAEVAIGPGPAHESWLVTRMSVQVTGVAEPSGEVRVYLDTVAPETFIGGSYDGVNDSSDESFNLQPGQQLCFLWSNVEPIGGTATATVFYERQTA